MAETRDFDNLGVPFAIEEPGHFKRGYSAPAPELELSRPTSGLRRGVSEGYENLKRGISGGSGSGGENLVMSFGCVRDMSVGDSRQKHLKRHVYMKSFLRANGFRGVNVARCGGCFVNRESVYPIHVAAQKGDFELVKILLKAGADPSKETSRGRTAEDFAEEADMYGSHKQILVLLRGQAGNMLIGR